MTNSKEETMTPTDRNLRDVLALAAVERDGWDSTIDKLRLSGEPLNVGEPNPVAMPLGGATVSGTKITVDTYVNPPTKIPARIRNLVAADEGYFIEQIFGTLGAEIQGGAVISEETFPEDFFLPAGEGPAPRAPGAEAPRLGSTRHKPQVNRPESWSGSVEVTDEARQRNNVLAVQRQFTQAANSFAYNVQTRGIEVLLTAVTAWGREAEAKVNWVEAHSTGVVNVDPLKMPAYDIARVLAQFKNDKVGVRPDTMLMNTNEAVFFRTFYDGTMGRKDWQTILSSYGLTLIDTPLIPEGEILFVKSGAPGVIGWELPLGQEKVREGTRKTDVYVLECRPVFAAFDASAVWKLTSTNT